MSETNNSLETQKEKLKQSLTQMLQDSRISPKEARELIIKFQLEKKEILEITQTQLFMLQEQFGSEIGVNNFEEYMHAQVQKYLDTSKPKKELLYEGLTDFEHFEKTGGISLDLEHPQKPENISDNEWQEAQKLLAYCKNIHVQQGKIAFTKEKGVVLELDTSGSNLYIKLDGDNVRVTGQNEGKLFVEELSTQEFATFVAHYDKKEFKRVLEQIGFTGGLTLGGILTFSLKTGIGWLLGYIGTGFGVYKGYQVFKNYHLSHNDALRVIQENKGNIEGVKSYLYLAQSGYITGYDNGRFTTLDNETLDIADLDKKQSTLDVGRYQLLRGLREHGLAPKKSGENIYELDMVGLFDHSPLEFHDGKIKFSTTYFENGISLEFQSVEEAFAKIQTINEVIQLELQQKSTHSSENTFDFNDQGAKNEAKIQKLKHTLLQK